MFVCFIPGVIAHGITKVMNKNKKAPSVVLVKKTVRHLRGAKNSWSELDKSTKMNLNIKYLLTFCTAFISGVAKL